MRRQDDRPARFIRAMAVHLLDLSGLTEKIRVQWQDESIVISRRRIQSVINDMPSYAYWSTVRTKCADDLVLGSFGGGCGRPGSSKITHQASHKCRNASSAVMNRAKRNFPHPHADWSMKKAYYFGFDPRDHHVECLMAPRVA